MKIALLLTGQLRTFDMLKYLHMNSIIKKYDTDVFLGIDVDNALQCEYKNSTNKTDRTIVEKAIDFFIPKDYFVLEEFNNENKSFELLFRQYYVVHNVYKLLINYIEKTETNYDIIIRLRFDQFLFNEKQNIGKDLLLNNNNEIIYSENNMKRMDSYSKKNIILFEKEIMDNDIYLLGFGDFKHYKYANDQFCYHNSKILDTMCNFYNEISNLMEYCDKNKIGNDGALIETIFYLYLTKNKINLKKSEICGIFVREKTN